MLEAFFERRPEHMPLGKLLPRVGTAVSRYYQRAVGEHGCTPTSLGALGILSLRDGLSHRELAGALGVTPATLTPVVDALEATGELRRDRDPTDRRVVRLSLTVSGHEHLRAMSAQVATDLHERLPHLPAGHEQIIRGYLIAVLAAVSPDVDR